MFFELNGKTYGIKFSREGTTTLATLYVVNEKGELVGTGITGIAILYYKDTFRKSKGRKEALVDVLYQLSVPDKEGIIPPGLSKNDRRVIWEAYFKNHSKK